MTFYTTFDDREVSADGFLQSLWERRFRLSGSWSDTAKAWLMRGYHMPSLCHLALRRGLLIGRGHEIASLTVLPKIRREGPGTLSVGRETVIMETVRIVLHSDVTIGSRVTIKNGVKLLTGSHDSSDPWWRTFAKPIVIKDYAWISENCILLPGVAIGRGAIVGPGSVVRSDIPDYSVAFGNPALVHSQRSPAELNYNPIEQVAAFQTWLGAGTEPDAKDDGLLRFSNQAN